MATLSILLNKTTFTVGETVEARLIVNGADPESRTVTGTCTVDGVEFDATSTYVLTHKVDGHAVTGFAQDATDPALWRKTAG